MTIKHEATLRLHKLWLKGDKGGVRANLSGANLSRADLSGTDLSRAYLSGTDLSRAYLMDAYLSRADLSGTDLSGTDLSRANLMGANLMGARLEYADLINADLKGAKIDYQIQDGLLREITKIILENPKSLEMGSWHTCETTHCRGGWVIHLAGEGGKALEWVYGTSAAAAIIYIASDNDLERVPDFDSSDADALSDMKRLAELEKAKEQSK